MIDCVDFQCEENRCSFKGRIASADICNEEGTLLIRFHDNRYPMCEHTWERAKQLLDAGLKEARESRKDSG
jgi:hypothetical protein